VTVGVLEELQSKTQGIVPGYSRAPGKVLPLGQSFPQGADTIEQYALLAAVMGIKSGSRDIGALDQILDRNCLIAFLENQSDQGMPQCIPGPHDSAIGCFRCLGHLEMKSWR